jgi:hypothetical protein
MEGVRGGRRRDIGGLRWPAAGWRRAAVAGGRQRDGGGLRLAVRAARLVLEIYFRFLLPSFCLDFGSYSLVAGSRSQFLLRNLNR